MGIVYNRSNQSIFVFLCNCQQEIERKNTMKLPSFVSDLSLPPMEYHQNLRHWSREMRECAPIIWDDASANWLVFRYDEIARVSSDYKVFSSEHTVIGSPQDNASPSLIEMDPPQHQRMRSRLTQAFSARTIAQMEGQIAQIVDTLLEKILEYGETCDWVAELANPLPVIVIANMLGLPAENWQQFKSWTDAIINKSQEQTQASERFSKYFDQAIEACRKHPGSDILSLLIASEVGGEHLSHDELISFCFTLFIAGNITTTNMLGNMVLVFDKFPQELERLRRQPELAASAVEEILRYMPPFRAGPNDFIEGRVAKSDVVLCDQLVRAGEQVQVNRLSANFDERQFPDPERLDIGRNPNRHQSFGHGVHFCLGAPLARLELRVALERIIQKFRSLEVAPDATLKQAPSTVIFGVQNLPVTFQPA
jgi:cytochrome P450